VDFGWFPDPWGFWRVHFDAARRTAYVFFEAVELRATNKKTAGIIKAALTVDKVEIRELVICDSAEPKSIADYRDEGIDARPVPKGQGSVEYGIKWLQSLREIVIDGSRCPMAAEEFTLYEYEQTRDGDYTTSLPDANNHSIDGVRYAMSSAINRRQ
jgi:phage terminase large subunit